MRIVAVLVLCSALSASATLRSTSNMFTDGSVGTYVNVDLKTGSGSDAVGSDSANGDSDGSVNGGISGPHGSDLGQHGIRFEWPLSGDLDLDAAAKKVALWTTQATHQVALEQMALKSTASIKYKVMYLSNKAKQMSDKALRLNDEAGGGMPVNGGKDTMLSMLHEAEAATQETTAQKRILSVQMRTRIAVTKARREATAKRDLAIRALLDLKLERLSHTAKLVRLLSEKVEQMRVNFQQRMLLARTAASEAKNSTAAREPDTVIAAKLDASDKALTVAHSVKVYLGGLEFKKKCAEEKLHTVQCSLKINCTVAQKAAPEPPRWDTPTLEALRNEMVTALKEHGEAMARIPVVPVVKPVENVAKNAVAESAGESAGLAPAIPKLLNATPHVYERPEEPSPCERTTTTTTTRPGTTKCTGKPTSPADEVDKFVAAHQKSGTLMIDHPPRASTTTNATVLTPQAGGAAAARFRSVGTSLSGPGLGGEGAEGAEGPHPSLKSVQQSIARLRLVEAQILAEQRITPLIAFLERQGRSGGAEGRSAMHKMKLVPQQKLLVDGSGTMLRA